MEGPSCQLLLGFLMLTTICASAAHLRTTMRFGGMRWYEESSMASVNAISPEFEVHNYTQSLDHFNFKPESYATFQQRYILNYKYWGGANTSSPIFVYLGAEIDVTQNLDLSIVDLAARFKGLLLYIEHRYYGVSMPFGSEDEAFQNSSTFGYLSSEQALADYAQVIVDVKKDLSAENCPAIAVGGSYGGMLASWFRLKYPHIVIGSLASSAPILYFDDITPQNGYHVIVSKDFRDTSESCYNTIQQSWAEIDRVASETNGLLNLSNIFTTCSPLNSSKDLKVYTEIAYMWAAQLDNPPSYPVNKICSAIDGAPSGTDILGRVAAGVNASVFGNSCHSASGSGLSRKSASAWEWQTCTEMVFPMGYGENETMFQSDPFDINNYTKECVDVFGIKPRPHWITTEFGGHDIKTVLGNFASNIIFSNGLRDPWSAGGVLEDISDSVVALYTEQGSHCLDLYPPTSSDPDWLLALRDKENKIIAYWLAEYYTKLN
ncbi:uncharacterized protein LOC7463334 [Populus trichocarpa]|nr:uncharacterized protein LOC7463334 [Populus trichocarpa]